MRGAAGWGCLNFSATLCQERGNLQSDEFRDAISLIAPTYLPNSKTDETCHLEFWQEMLAAREWSALV